MKCRCICVVCIENGRFKKGGEPTPIFIFGPRLGSLFLVEAILYVRYFDNRLYPSPFLFKGYWSAGEADHSHMEPA